MSKPRDTLRNQIGTFVMLPTFVLDCCKDANAIHVYAIIARHANQERVAWPGQERIAAQMGASLRTVQRGLDVLRDAKVLTSEPRREGGVIVGTNYTLMARPDYVPPVARSGEQTQGTPLDMVVGRTTNADATRQSNTTKQGSAYKEELDPFELDPKSAYARDKELLNTHAAVVFADYRIGWEGLYKQPTSLIDSHADLYKIQQHLQVLGLARLRKALVRYFITTDDSVVRRARHRLGLFLANPSQYLVDEVQHVADARTGDERRRQTHQSNADHVAGQGRLAGKLTDDTAHD